MKLSRNFSLDEFTRSTAAKINSIDNTPPPMVLANLGVTAAGLEQVRELLGNKPITITSGYRSPKLNQVVGGSKGSQHMTGQAVDFVCPGFGSPAKIMQTIVDSAIEYDQCVLEYASKTDQSKGWIHISFCSRPRMQALVVDESGARNYA